MTKSPTPTPSQQWLEFVYDSDLSGHHKSICAYLASKMYGKKIDCFPSAATITKNVGWSERKVRTCLNELIEKKWITVKGLHRSGTRILTISTPAQRATPAPHAPAPHAPLHSVLPPPAHGATESVTESVIKHISIRGWDEWVSYRREIKKKMTPATIKRQVKQLEALTPDQQLATIEQSITNGWTGLFPDKVTSNGSGQNKSNGRPHTQRGPEVVNLSELFDTGHVIDG